MTLTRRQFLKRTFYICGALGVTDAMAVEPRWLEVHPVDFTRLGWGKTIVHLTDLHYRGNREWLSSIVKTTNAQKPDLVCVTGDLMDRRNTRHLPEALEVLRGLNAPVFGVPGNHDPFDGASIAACRKAFAETGGGWLLSERVDCGKFVIHGSQLVTGLSARESKPTLLLCHYPAVGEERRLQPYDLILSGHSHGGQCRIPGLPPLHLPDHVGRYVEGIYQAPAGTLYVSRGLGSSVIPLRFFCRPEMPVIRT
ncbi:MAG TPA: metallophosphoesterase [Luteolibacter sp.]